MHTCALSNTSNMHLNTYINTKCYGIERTRIANRDLDGTWEGEKRISLHAHSLLKWPLSNKKCHNRNEIITARCILKTLCHKILIGLFNMTYLILKKLLCPLNGHPSPRAHTYVKVPSLMLYVWCLCTLTGVPLPSTIYRH